MQSSHWVQNFDEDTDYRRSRISGLDSDAALTGVSATKLRFWIPLIYGQAPLLDSCINKNFDFVYGDARDERVLHPLLSKADCNTAAGRTGRRARMQAGCG